MKAESFIQSRKEHWQRAKELIVRGRKGLGKLSQEDLRELTHLYSSLTVDVARARMYQLDSRMRENLNALAMGAHSLLYRPPARPLWARVWRFVTTGYPRLFRKMKPWMLLSTLLFFLSALGSYAVVRDRPSMAYVLLPAGLDVQPGREVVGEDVSRRYRNMPPALMNTQITLNNIQVAFLAFAAGILLGLGTLYVLLVNGIMLGTFFAHFTNHSLAWEVWSFLTPHGALEIFAILVSACAGLRLGLSAVLPGQLTRGESLRQGAREAVLLLLGTVPMFILAGAVESYVTPSYLPGGVKILLGLSLLGATLAYLLVCGRCKEAPETNCSG